MPISSWTGTIFIYLDNVFTSYMHSGDLITSYVVIQGDESVAAEKLRQLNLNSSTTSKNLISGKECREVPSANQSLVCLS